MGSVSSQPAGQDIDRYPIPPGFPPRCSMACPCPLHVFSMSCPCRHGERMEKTWSRYPADMEQAGLNRSERRLRARLRSKTAHRRPACPDGGKNSVRKISRWNRLILSSIQLCPQLGSRPSQAAAITQKARTAWQATRALVTSKSSEQPQPLLDQVVEFVLHRAPLDDFLGRTGPRRRWCDLGHLSATEIILGAETIAGPFGGV